MTFSQIIVLTSAQKISVGQINNRVIYLAPEISYSEYAQHGALDHITTMMQGIESIDFLVVDGVLIQSVTQPLVQMILYSTIWFDISTGSTFIAHSDDGFIQKAFYELGKVNCFIFYSPYYLYLYLIRNLKIAFPP